MGSYYAGIMNATDVDKLEHFQVKGAKWGRRRWQNMDGSLTPAGRIHYGVGPARKERSLENGDGPVNKSQSKEKDKLAKTVAKGNKDIRKTIQGQDAVSRLKDNVRQQVENERKLRDMEDEFLSDKDTYEKYLKIGIDKRMEKYPDLLNREEIEDYYKYDNTDGKYQDLDSNPAFDAWIESDDPKAKAYVQKMRDNIEIGKQNFDKAREFADEYLGNKSYDEVTRSLGGIMKNRTTLRDSFANATYYEALNQVRKEPAKPLETNNVNTKKQLPTGDDASSKMQKEYKRLRNLAGTKSLLGGDHTNDASAKVIRQYTDEIAKNQKSLDRSRTKEEYRDKNWKITEKYIDKYAEAVLEDMGYDATEKNINWIKKQEWFGLPRAEFI